MKWECWMQALPVPVDTDTLSCHQASVRRRGSIEEAFSLLIFAFSTCGNFPEWRQEKTPAMCPSMGRKHKSLIKPSKALFIKVLKSWANTNTHWRVEGQFTKNEFHSMKMPFVCTRYLSPIYKLYISKYTNQGTPQTDPQPSCGSVLSAWLWRMQQTTTICHTKCKGTITFWDMYLYGANRHPLGVNKVQRCTFERVLFESPPPLSTTEKKFSAS